MYLFLMLVNYQQQKKHFITSSTTYYMPRLWLEKCNSTWKMLQFFKWSILPLRSGASIAICRIFATLWCDWMRSLLYFVLVTFALLWCGLWSYDATLWRKHFAYSIPCLSININGSVLFFCSGCNFGCQDKKNFN